MTNFFEVVGYVAVGLVGLQLLLGSVTFIWRRLWRRFNWAGKHVFITGGSRGLGRSIALLAAQRGASVTVIAREQPVLDAVVADMEARRCKPSQRFLGVSCDVTDKAAVAAALKRAREELGPLDVVITAAGAALPGLIHKIPVEHFERQVQLNYLGTVYTVHDAVKTMIEQQSQGKIVIISSTMSVCAFAGYAQYAPTKAALKSFADCLRNELQPYGITVHHLLPPTMKTEGLETENRIKPAVTRHIEGTGQELDPDDCAKSLFAGIDRGEYSITADALTWLMRINANGTTPRNNVFFEAALAPVITTVLTIVTAFFDRTVRTFRGD